MSTLEAPDGTHLLDTVFRAASWARIGLMVHALVVNMMRMGQAAHPGLLMAACAVMLVWSVVDLRRKRDLGSRRLNWEIALDMAITLLLVGGSRFVLGEELLRESYLGVTVYWMLAAPSLVALCRGPWLGMGLGVLIGAAQFGQAPALTPRAWSDMLLMVAIPYFIGLLINELTRTESERDRNFATAVALEERERLNRIVHDGVLQVLAMVAREGNELGPRGKMLAVLAHKQEDQLRATLQDRRVDVIGGDYLDVALTDVTTMLEKHQSRNITVSTMAGHVNMATPRAKELDAVVTEVLSNVFKHAGVDARTWVLLEQEGNEIILSVRDDGVGMTPQQLEAAAEAGRLGVKESIVGRVLDLGGTSTLQSAPGEGTEWEFRIPLEL